MQVRAANAKSGFKGVREVMVQEVVSRRGEGQAAHDAVKLTASLASAYTAIDDFSVRRTLPLPGEFVDETGAPKGKKAVNPTVWPARKPYVSISDGGGLIAPWQMLEGLATAFPDIDSALFKRDGSPVCRTVLDAALCVFGRVVAAFKRLDAADCTRVVLDAGDVCSFADRNRAALEERGVPPAEMAAKMSFDRMHLSNVPDYVRPRYPLAAVA